MDKSKKNKTQPPATVQNFPIVGIGASAGGLDAFKRLLKAIPEDSGMAYVLVQHLDPTHESILPEILQRVTKIPVMEITDDIPLAPDHIYIIPSNKILTSTDGVLQLTPRDKKSINLSIDVFFTSLANVHKEFAVGIVLSGTGSDGTLGLKAIKEHGGISIAQDSESAAYDSMPQSAIHAGVVDFILAPDKIPAQLLQINSAYKTNHFYTNAGDENDQPLPKDDETIFKQILLLLRQRSGVDFTYYKQPTFHRRIARRIAIAKKENLADYLKLLRTDKAEQDALFQDVLIPVTSFFRDPKTFNTLFDTIFPAIFKNKSADDPVRVWIAGCSTGEEAFSIAICLHEFLGKRLSDTKIQIFASDISEKAIKKARAAIYTKLDVEKLSATQLKNYFVKNNGGYEVIKVIRDMCVFAPHNFLKDPPFAKMDLITCRNVLIYMDTFLQKKAFITFHYALKENGFLLLGKSETTGASSDLFTQVDKHEKIYSRKPAPGRFMHIATERSEAALRLEVKTVTKHETVHTDFRKSAEAIMISKSPASVVVNDAMDIVHIHGDITPFLQAPQGKPTHNLIKMAREGLAFELRNAIHKATKENASVIKENIPVTAIGKQSLVTIEIIPLTDTVDTHFLIRFEKKIIPDVQEELQPSSGKTKIAETQKRNEQLEMELSHTREDMRSITEDMEAGNEELQSANEELQSSNEEMQSLNEELETSKEELQSTNEELLIVNQELVDKQEQLNTSRLYSEAIVTTMREPLVVLDKTLRVKTANASFYKKFNVDENETENKLFYEIQNHQFDDTMLRSLLENILPQKNRIEDFEIKLRLPDKGERIILINGRQIVNEKKAEQLILLALEDITDRVRSEKILKENEARSEKERKLLHDFFTQAPAVLAILKGPEFVFEFANPAYLELIGKRNLIGKTMLEALPETAGQGFIELLDNVYKTGETFTGKEMPITVDKDNGKHEKFYLNFTYQAFSNDKGETEGILVFAYDVTEQVMGRKLIEESEQRFSNILSQSIMSIAILKGSDLIIASANDKMMTSWGKGKNIIGKPLLEVLYELKGQPFPAVMQKVLANGVPYYGYEEKAILIINGKEEVTYYNYLCQPYTEVDNSISGVTILANEVTEQVLAKKMVEASEKRFSNILSQSLMAVCILKGRELVVASANDSILDMWGKGKNVIGKTLIEVLPEIKDQPFLKLIDDVYTTGVPFATPEIKAVLIRNGKPEECYFNLVYQPYRDVDDTVTGITVFATEITKQVIVQKQIEANEKEQNKVGRQLKLATDSAKIGIWSLDIVSSKLEWSIIHKLMWGYNEHREDLTYEDWHNLILPEDKELAFQRIEESKVNHTLYKVDYRIIRANDGAIVWIKTTGQYYYDEFGVAHTLTGISIDISEQKEAEELIKASEAKFRTLSETIPHMIWSATADGQKNFFNKFFIDYTGLSFEELKGNGMRKIIYPADLKKDLQLWHHSLKTGEDFNMEKRMRHHDGTYRWHLSHGIAQKDLLGKITGWVGSSTEIEEQKIFTEQLESKVKERTTELQTLNEELKQSNSQLDQFAYVASHDLQEPLRKIITFSMRLKDKHNAELSTEVKTYLNKIEDASSRMTTLIKDLLNYSRLLQHEKLFTRVDLNETLKNILSDFEERIVEKKAVFKIETLPTIETIPLQMNQLFYNLISNALKFTKENVAPLITITSSKLSKLEIKKYPSLNTSSNYFEIIFKDNGIGFNQKYDKQIFTIFQRLHDAKTYFGTGIGLALCKKIVENHQGEIFVKAEENKGAAFHIILPIKY